MTPPLLQVKDVRKHFVVRYDILGRPRSTVHAVDGVSLSLDRGDTLALVGESGCGKSSLGRLVTRLDDPTSGEVVIDGKRIDTVRGLDLRPFRRRVQIVFQDPYSSLNPRHRIREVLTEPLENFGLATSASGVAARLDELLGQVGLPADALDRYPHEFSGGQRQRIAIARALAPGPDLLVCDEAVSALDVSVKAQIVNLLHDIQAATGLALLFISHDLAIVEHLTHRVAVMYLGRIAEEGDREAIFGAPRHPYTRALMSAVPIPEPRARRGRIVLRGDVPSPLQPPAGCRFHTRCPFAQERCRSEEPALRAVAGDDTHRVACHFDDLPRLVQ